MVNIREFCIVLRDEIVDVSLTATDDPRDIGTQDLLVDATGF
jgi:hypothetical protein